MYVALKSFIRDLLTTIQKDCSSYTGDIQIANFVNNCRNILEKRKYFPLSEEQSVTSICTKLMQESTTKDNCDSIAKSLVKSYFLTKMQPIFTYLVQFSTSDYFTSILKKEMTKSWDFTKFDVATTSDASRTFMLQVEQPIASQKAICETSDNK